VGASAARFAYSMKRILFIFVSALILIYLGDFVSVRYGIPGNRPPYGSVTVTQTYAVPEKDPKKEDYFFQPPVAKTCVNSLLPHFGYPPCWYLARHAKQRVDF
jgi:hypothetical protein